MDVNEQKQKPDGKSTSTKPQDQKMSRDTIIVLAVLAFSALVMMLNETILSVALPAIMADFDIPANTAQWLTTGFMLTMAVVIPTTGYLLKRFTTKSLFIAALSFFIAGTVIAALAPSFIVLLAGRIVQAVGTAIIMPLLMTFSLTVVPANRRGTVMGLIAVVMAVAPALGPTVSGFILNSLTWHWLFWVMVPIAVVALLIGGIFIRNITETSSSPLDVLSVILSALAFGGLVYALSSMSDIIDGQGAQRTITITIAVIGVVALIWFIARQIKLQRDDRELLNLKPFTITNFTVSVVVLLIVFATLLGSVTVLPIFLQTAMGVSALTTGMLMLPGGLVNGILSPFIGRIYDAVGPRPLLWPGIVIATGSVFAMSRLDENSTTTQFIIIHVIFSISLAMMISSLMTTALGALPTHLYGHGSAIVNTLQQLAGATGTALLVLVLTLGTDASAAAGAALNVATADGAQNAFVFATVLLAIGLVVSLFVKRNPLTVDVKEKMEPQAPQAAEESEQPEKPAYDRA